MTIAEKIAHLQGLAEGLDIHSENSKEAKLLAAMLDVLGSISQELTELHEDVELVTDELDELSEEVADLEEDYYGEDDGTWPYDGEEDYDLDDEDDEYEDDEILYSVKCPKCGEEMTLDEDTLLAGNIRCDNCDQLFSLEVIDEDDESEDYDEEDD